AVFAYWLVFMLGVNGIKPVIGAVPPHTVAAQAQLHKGDEIVAVGDNSIGSWQELRLTLLDRALDSSRVRLTVVDGDGAQRTVLMDMQHVPEDPQALFKQLGLSPYTPPTTPVLARIVADSPAADSGLQEGDRVLAINDQAMTSPT